jgi:hypothetical protein
MPRPVLTWVPLIDWGLPLLALISISTIVLASRVGVRRLAAWEAS